MDPNGNWLWAKKAGGIDRDEGVGITIDEYGNSYITGHFKGTAIFGSNTITSSGFGDIFIASMDVNSNWLWVTEVGGSWHDTGNAITIDHTGSIYSTGTFMSTLNFGSYSLTSNGDLEIFVAKLGYDSSIDDYLIPNYIELTNYPNPFNPSTTIEFSIQNNSKVELSVFSIIGQKIKTLANNQFTKGLHSIPWCGDDESGKSVCSGIYFYKLIVNGNTEAVKKCVLLK